jgi:hypothetical protein
LFKIPQWLFRVVGGKGVARAYVFAFILSSFIYLEYLVITLLCTARMMKGWKKKIEINFHSNIKIE